MSDKFFVGGDGEGNPADETSSSSSLEGVGFVFVQDVWSGKVYQHSSGVNFLFNEELTPCDEWVGVVNKTVDKLTNTGYLDHFVDLCKSYAPVCAYLDVTNESFFRICGTSVEPSIQAVYTSEDNLRLLFEVSYYKATKGFRSTVSTTGLYKRDMIVYRDSSLVGAIGNFRDSYEEFVSDLVL